MTEELFFDVDENDRLLDASCAWDAFAASNDAPELAIANIRGQSLYDFIADPETAELQRMLLKQARNSSRPLSYRIRCDSPAMLRLLKLVVYSPDGMKVRTVSTLIEMAAQDSGLLLERNVERSEKCLRICSWCLKVKVDSEWLNPDKAATSIVVPKNQTNI